MSTSIGVVPTLDGIDRSGLSIPDAVMAELLKVDVREWETAQIEQKRFLASLIGRIPTGILEEHQT